MQVRILPETIMSVQYDLGRWSEGEYQGWPIIAYKCKPAFDPETDQHTVVLMTDIGRVEGTWETPTPQILPREDFTIPKTPRISWRQL